MRHVLPVSTAVLIGALLSVGAVVAQQRPGWVDPPARSAGPETAPQRAERPASGAEAAGQTGEAAEERATQAANSRSGRRGARRSEPTPRLAETAPGPERAVARGSRREERRSAARRAERRLAEAPRRPSASLRFAPPAMDEPQGTVVPGGPQDPRFSAWAGASQRLTVAYLDSVSASNAAMIASAPRFYGDSVWFHGRTMSMTALIAEKRRFVQRWPERRYEPRIDEMRIACNAANATCMVRAVYDYLAFNPARDTRAQGVGELVLTISLAGERPVIVSETSRILSRGPARSAAARTGRGV